MIETSTATMSGSAQERFANVQRLAERNLAAGLEVGLSLTVDLEGETVLDLWDGYADGARTRAWERDTIVNVWSSTKMVTCLAALILIDRGLVDVDAPIARYWPEFGANGKEEVTLAQVMSHTSGVSGWDSLTVDELFDRELATARLAGQAPWWEPGTASGYHSNNLGHLIGEVVRRVTGMTLTDFIREEIAVPLGADFRLGVSPDDEYRVAEILPPPPHDFDFAAADPDDIMVKTFAVPILDATVANSTAWRRAEIGAVNGHSNSRALARILSTISRGGTVDGVTLLSEKTVDLIQREQSNGVDQVLGIPMRWGVGYALPSPEALPYIPTGRVCFWGGWGGSMTVMDRDRQLTISYVMNQMAAGIIGSDRSAEYISAVYDALA